MARIVESAQTLLLERAPAEARVVDICRAAGVTVGGFYSRFADKDALLDHLEERARGEFVRFVTDLAETAEIVRPELATYIGALLRGLAEAYERNGGIIRRMVERAQRDAGLRERLAGVNRENMDRTMAAIATLGEVDHPEPEVALEFALLAQRSILREALLFPDAWGARRIVGRDALLAEVRRMMVRYLGLAEEPDPDATS
ncbi:MAG: TetR/AcrR family transcriptional regulator [Acidobacteria bacterium]|nr:TetR/AcrR family transcriptional regulator [Acidobacteriota bacterium]MCB9378364.1 TetR/AcrR family transcriptional regulator [Holophagales bacterium]